MLALVTQEVNQLVWYWGYIFFTLNVLLRWISLVLDYLDANSISASKSTQVWTAIFILQLSCEVQFHPWTIKVAILVLQPFVLGSILSLVLRSMPCYLATSAPVFHSVWFCVDWSITIFERAGMLRRTVLSLNHLIQKHLGRKTDMINLQCYFLVLTW